MLRSLLTLTLTALAMFPGAKASAQGPAVPPTGQRYHGVGRAFGGSVPQYIGALTDCSIMGIPSADPAVINPGMYALPGRLTGPSPLDVKIASGLAEADLRDMIPQISISFKNQNGSSSENDILNGVHDALIQRVGRLIAIWDKELFLRLGFEFNTNGYTPYTYPQVYRYVANRLASAGVTKASYIWCYFPGGDDDYLDQNAAGQNKWFPGSTFVDWWGLDVFYASQFDPASPNVDSSNQPTIKGKAYSFLTDSASQGYPVMISEASAAGANLAPGTAAGVASWLNWYKIFFDFIEAQPVVRGFVYLNHDWTGTTQWNLWGDARIEQNPEVVVPLYALRVTDPARGYWNGPTPFSCGF